MCRIRELLQGDAKMRSLLNQNAEGGYTLIEHLLQLLILSVFLQLIITFFYWKAPLEEQYKDLTLREWELFSAELQSQLSNITHIEVLESGRGIRFKNNRGVIDIEQSTHLIRKQVDRLGFTPLLTNIKSSYFTIEGNTVHLDVTWVNGIRRERWLVIGLYSE